MIVVSFPLIGRSDHGDFGVYDTQSERAQTLLSIKKTSLCLS